MQVDLLARPLAEAGEGLEPARAERDVERVGELGAHAAGRLGRRAARQGRPFEEHHLDAGLREVERGARAHHAATDDDHVGALGQDAGRHAAMMPVPVAGTHAERCPAGTTSATEHDGSQLDDGSRQRVVTQGRAGDRAHERHPAVGQPRRPRDVARARTAQERHDLGDLAGVPRARPSGMPGRGEPAGSWSSCPVIAVAISPGPTLFTVIPCSASSSAITLVSRPSPPLAAL